MLAIQRRLHTHRRSQKQVNALIPGTHAGFGFWELIKSSILIASVFFINKFGAAGNAVSYGILIIMAAWSTIGAVKALSISALIIIGNQFIIDVGTVAALMRFALVVVAVIRVAWDAISSRRSLFAYPHLNALIVFVFVCAALSMVTKYYLVISLLKLAIFGAGAYALLYAAELQRGSRTDLGGWFVSIAGFLVAGSGISYIMGVGYTFRRTVRDAGEGLGFAGITGHPQTLGVLSAISFVYLFCMFLYSPYRLRWVAAVLCIPLAGLCYMSAARSGILAAFLTIAFVLILTWAFMTFASNGMRRVRFNLNLTQILSICAIGIFSLTLVETATGGGISSRISDVLLKAVRQGQGENVSIDAMFQSRMHLIDRSWYIFTQKPITGIGFGTSVDPYFIENATLFSAPTEKGFMPTAILEETGAVGTLTFLVFLILLFRHLWINRNVIGIAMLACFLFLNLGEMMFFSLGGMGLFCWSITAAAIILGDRCVLIRRGPIQPPPAHTGRAPLPGPASPHIRQTAAT